MAIIVAIFAYIFRDNPTVKLLVITGGALLAVIISSEYFRIFAGLLSMSLMNWVRFWGVVPL
ncbi:MAG: hypothetical protein RMK18_07765 [Armatimonadota bacterium]|nr:hypothetical protein [Armatimonadota bacterium]MDW8025740.1 hypothetical protein [Armatimonadota bacterium]